MLGYLPAKFKHPLPASRSRPTTSGATSRGRTRRSCRPSPTTIRARDPGRAARHGRRRAQRLVRMRTRKRRILITGLSTLLGRPARAGARARPRRRDDHRRRPPTTRRSSSSARSSSASATARAASAGSSQAAEIDTVVDTRLVVDSIVSRAARRAREQRHRDDEHPRGVRRARLAGAQGRLQVQRALLRLRARRPGVLHRGDGRARTRRARRSSATSSRPSAPSREFAPRNPDVTVTVLRFANGLGPDAARPRTRRSSACPWCPAILGFDPRYQFIHEDDIVGVPASTRCATTCDGVYNGARRRRARAQRGREPARQAARAGAAAVGDRRSRPAALRPGRRAHPAGDARPAALRARRWTTASSRRPATASATRRARRCIKLREHLRLRRCIVGDRSEPYRYEREVEEFLRCSPSVRPAARRPDPAPTNLPPGERRGASPAQGSGGLRRPATQTSSSLYCPHWSPRRWPSSRPTRARTPRGPRS